MQHKMVSSYNLVLPQVETRGSSDDGALAPKSELPSCRSTYTEVFPYGVLTAFVDHGSTAAALVLPVEHLICVHV